MWAARGQRPPPAPSYRSQEERNPQGPLGKRPHGPAAPHRAALKVRQAAPHPALRGRDSRAQSSPPRARQPLALPRKSTRKASQRSLSLLEQNPEGTGTRRCAHSRPAAFIRQLSREFRPFAVRGPETAGTQRSENDHALCPSGTGTASGRRRNSQRLPQIFTRGKIAERDATFRHPSPAVPRRDSSRLTALSSYRKP